MRLIRVRLVLVNLNPINDTYMARQVFAITHVRMQVVWARRDHPMGDDLCPYGRTGVVGEKGSGNRLPHWEEGKGQACYGSGH